MEQTYTGFGYVFLEIEPYASNKEKRTIAEDIVRLGNGNVQAIEFFKDEYKAAARFETPDEQMIHELVNNMGKIKGIKKDSLHIRYMLACKPYIEFKELEQPIVVSEK
jgi:hypothetical protein